jgi:5'-deoxynucleotidase YfbR-like HD superfamily hydrolase
MSSSPDLARGEWLQTYLGKRFYVCDPRPEDMDIEVIAHALSQQVRFSGHTRGAYSVAQHCVMVSDLSAREDALWGLLHDASEAYLVDIPSPLKRLPEFSGYLALEAKIMAAICDRYGLPREMPASVRHADLVALVTEARDLMSPLQEGFYGGLTPPEPMSERVEPLDPYRAKRLFLHRFRDLAGGR